MAQQLMAAAYPGDFASVRILVEGGTNVNAADGNGLTALHYAVEG